jgi:hypothetical protein
MANILALVLLLAPLLSGSLPPLRATPPTSVDGEHLVDAAGRPTFLLGVNYEGPADRAWQMWEDGKFEPALIEQDLRRARAANLAVLRVFVQRPLANDILAKKWTKLDRLLDLADRHELKLILTFADYGEIDVAKLAAVDRAVASRYRGRPTIFAYDLKNEPRFFDLALATYPPGVNAALQDPTLVASIGETVPREQIGEHRASEQGKKQGIARLSDDQAYVYVNVLTAYLRFLEDAGAWAREHKSTSSAYARSPDSAIWEPLKVALNETFAAWLSPRLNALNSADPDRPVTVGHVDSIIASLPVNAWLDYRSLHLYPSGSEKAITASLAVFRDVQAAIPGKPMVLGEFGFSNDTLDEEQGAALEAAMVRAVHEQGGAGALKWMLNDFPNGANPRENAFGMYRADGSAKPVVAAFQALGVLRPVARVAAGRP